MCNLFCGHRYVHNEDLICPLHFKTYNFYRTRETPLVIIHARHRVGETRKDIIKNNNKFSANAPFVVVARICTKQRRKFKQRYRRPPQVALH